MAARRLRPISETRPSARAKARGGYTLVEVMVAMLLTSIMVTSVFSVSLTVKTGGSKGERKIKAAAGSRQVAAMLKNFVTGDQATTTIPGPSSGTNSWGMTTAAGPGQVIDTCPDTTTTCYAMMQGTHTLTGIMPSSFEGAPYNARVKYWVFFTDTITDGVNTRPVPAVNITTTWTEP